MRTLTKGLLKNSAEINYRISQLRKQRPLGRSDTHAIEFDFGNGWAESIGQGLHYSAMTEKKAGIILILDTMKDRKYWIRLNTTIEYFNLPIDTWAVGTAAYNK